MSAELPHSALQDLFANQPPALFAQYHERPVTALNYFVSDDRQYRGAMRAELPIAQAKIDAMALMPDNWDGYGAIRIGQETTRNAKSALNTLHSAAPIPDITPNPNGTISLEWESTEGFGHLEIGRTKFSFYIKPRSGSPVLADGDAGRIHADIGKWVSKMLFPLQHSAETITKISFTGNVLRTSY